MMRSEDRAQIRPYKIPPACLILFARASARWKGRRYPGARRAAAASRRSHRGAGTQPRGHVDGGGAGQSFCRVPLCVPPLQPVGPGRSSGRVFERGPYSEQIEKGLPPVWPAGARFIFLFGTVRPGKIGDIFRPLLVVLLQHGHVGQEIPVREILCAGGTAPHARLTFDANAGRLHGLRVDASHRARRGARAALGAQGPGGQGARF